jgi:hypothetical protein
MPASRHRPSEQQTPVAHFLASIAVDEPVVTAPDEQGVVEKTAEIRPRELPSIAIHVSDLEVGCGDKWTLYPFEDQWSLRGLREDGAWEQKYEQRQAHRSGHRASPRDRLTLIGRV